MPLDSPLLPEQRLKILIRASWLGIIGNLGLAALKIVGGFFSQSLAVMGDGIDSLSDVVSSLVILYAAKKSSIPPDPEHPWGHGRVETIATKTLSLIMIIAGLQLLSISLRRLGGASPWILPGRLAFLVTGISVVVKTALALYKHRIAHRTGSAMMRADALNMRNDLVLSLMVLSNLFFATLFSLAILDILLSIAVSIWIMFVGLRLFLRTNTELMDSVQDKNVYIALFDAVAQVEGVKQAHRVRIRSLNSFYVINLDVLVDGTLTVNESHEITSRLEIKIREKITPIFDIIVHVEPEGIQEHVEGYGLALKDLSPPLQKNQGKKIKENHGI